MQFVCDFATGQATADDDDVVSDLLFAEKEVTCFDCFFHTGNVELSCHCASCNDDFVCIEFVYISDGRVELHFDAQIFDLFFIPFDEFFVFFFE